MNLKNIINAVKVTIILYFSGVRGVERYEHASLAASLKKMLMLKKKQLSCCL